MRRKEAKGDKKKERREEKQGNGEEMGFMWCSMIKSFSGMTHE